MKLALITRITGQDGAYLGEHLLGLGYRAVGAFRLQDASQGAAR